MSRAPRTERLLRWCAAASAALALAHTAQRAAAQVPPSSAATESRIAAGHDSLYARVIGKGPPVIVLHGGPDFDIAYLLPDLDRLGDRYRLIYYDQRGRGRSAAHTRAEDVTLASEVEDIDRVRRHYHLKTVALLGHSWGTVLALEYALKHPANVSYLILMNPAPASTSDLALMRTFYLAALGPEMEKQRTILESAAYKAGDPQAVIARYRIHFKPAFKDSAAYERLMAAMRPDFIWQGDTGIVKARAVEDRLMQETWHVQGFDLLPDLHRLRIPTLIITGDHDFIPLPVAEHIARSIPNARLVTIPDCGHFTYLECANAVHRAMDDFFNAAGH